MRSCKLLGLNAKCKRQQKDSWTRKLRDLNNFWWCEPRWPGQLQSRTPHSRRLHHWISTLLLIVPQHSDHQSAQYHFDQHHLNLFQQQQVEELDLSGYGRKTKGCLFYKYEKLLQSNSQGESTLPKRIISKTKAPRQQQQEEPTGSPKTEGYGKWAPVSARDYRQEIFGKFSNWV